MEGLLMVNIHVHYMIIQKKFQAKYPVNFQDRSFLIHIGRIVNRFLTTPGTVSKGKSSGWPPISDEIGNVKADKKVAHRDMVFSTFIH
jgi:hypothetical protein